MDNKKAGYLLLGAVILIVIIIYLFNNALVDIINASCSEAGHGDSCPMYDTLSTQTNLSLALAGLVALVAVFLILQKPQEKIIIKTKTIEKRRLLKKIDTSDLRSEEKKILGIIQENKTIFQADLIEKTEMGKAKITRILDRLEGRGFVERKRRGMTNVVVIKD